MDNRSRLDTECCNQGSTRLDRLGVEEAFDLISAEDQQVASAVARSRPEICEAIELVVASFRAGGRLIYVGAGTSGRLGVLDATECPPTFLSDPSMVQGIIAGGHQALTRSVEGAEDHPGAGAEAIDDRNVEPRDLVFAIATGGTTPFVHGALRRAAERGAKTVFLACVPENQAPDCADVSIRVLTGPEVLTGSTRLKAGTATKMVLNMVSTIAMARIGKVYRNFMVDVNTRASVKLADRGTRILQSLTARTREESQSLLKAAGGHVKTALVMQTRHVDRETAERQLEEVGGHVGRLIDSV